MRISLAAPAWLATLALALPAPAGEEPTVDARLGAEVTLALAAARSWLGRTDGASVEGGFAVAGSMRIRDGRNDWDTRGRVAASVGEAAEGDGLVKGSDDARLDTQVMHHALAWFGPFARAGVRASLARAIEVRGEPTRFSIQRDPDRVAPRIAERLVLTDPLLPLRLSQSAGAAIRPVRIEPVEVEIRFGVGARETFADGQLAPDDDRATPTVELAQARDASSMGGCFGLALAGSLEGGVIRYRLGGEALVPFLHRDLPAEDVRGAADLTTVDMMTSLSLEIAPGVALGYQFDALREPLVLDAFQYRNAVFVSLGTSALGRRPPL